MGEQSAVKRRKGGRQALPDDLRRSIRREVWLSAVELANIHKRAAAVGITIGEYIRRAATHAPIPKPPAPPVNMMAWQSLARLSANANQYQISINAGKAHAWPPELIPELLHAIHDVRMALIGARTAEDDTDDDPEN